MAQRIFEFSLGFIFIVVVVSSVIGAVDLIWQRAEHIRKNMMSLQEIRDELRDQEGDPMAKQARRQRSQEIVANKMLVDVPSASVVVVNPTHFAVALRWDGEAGTAPICVAKGVDEVARRIREIAAEHRVPIHRDPPTARTLYSEVEIGQEIFTEHYEAVAAAIRFAERIKRQSSFGSAHASS